MKALEDFLTNIVTEPHPSGPVERENRIRQAEELLTELRAEKHDGGPAFPQSQEGHHRGAAGWKRLRLREGMSLRKWYAGKALAGILNGYAAGIAELSAAELAACSFKIADAMLTAGENEDDRP